MARTLQEKSAGGGRRPDLRGRPGGTRLTWQDDGKRSRRSSPWRLRGVFPENRMDGPDAAPTDTPHPGGGRRGDWCERGRAHFRERGFGRWRRRTRSAQHGLRPARRPRSDGLPLPAAASAEAAEIRRGIGVRRSDNARDCRRTAAGTGGPACSTAGHSRGRRRAVVRGESCAAVRYKAFEPQVAPTASYRVGSTAAEPGPYSATWRREARACVRLRVGRAERAPAEPCVELRQPTADFRRLRATAAGGMGTG